MPEEIFKVEINEYGRTWLRRFSSLSLIILLITLLIDALSFYKIVPYVLRQNENTFATSIRFRNWIYLAYMIINCTLQVVQIIFYRKFAVVARRSVDNSDTLRFNNSFRWLFLQSVCFLIQMITSLLYFIYDWFGNNF